VSLEQALADNTAALKALTVALNTGTPAAKPTKAVKTPEVAPAPAPAPAAPTPAQASVASTEITVTAEQIKAAGSDLSTLAEKDRAAAVGILAEFGVQKMTAMPPSKIPEFHAKVKAKLAASAAPSLV
jgi:predicted component of type VI protein secretion system